MISAQTSSNSGQFVSRLTQRAAQLAKSRAEMKLRVSRGDGQRWRSAHLLWPLFTKG